MTKIKYIKCDVCNGLGGIPCNIDSDDPDYYIIDGKNGIMCPKCNGKGYIIRYRLDDNDKINPLVRDELFYEVIKQEMYERNWDYADLTYESGCEMHKLFQLLHKRAPLTDKLVEGLAKAFDTSAEFWWNLYKETNNVPKEEA